MGPAACLADVESHLSDCDFEEAAYSLASYFRWRIEGGFEPVNGDHLAIVSLARLGKNADKFRQSNQSATDTIQRLRDSMATALDAS